MEHQALATSAGGAHVAHFGAALGELLHHDAGIGLINVDNHFFDGFQPLAMFIEHGTKVYAGMIIGEHTRGNDLELNVIKGKKLTNVRASGKDEAVVLTPPIKMSLEKALAYVGDDELVEITPKSIRLRKIYLDANERKRMSRAKEAAEVA